MLLFRSFRRVWFFLAFSSFNRSLLTPLMKEKLKNNFGLRIELSLKHNNWKNNKYIPYHPPPFLTLSLLSRRGPFSESSSVDILHSDLISTDFERGLRNMFAFSHHFKSILISLFKHAIKVTFQPGYCFVYIFRILSRLPFIKTNDELNESRNDPVHALSFWIIIIMVR